MALLYGAKFRGTPPLVTPLFINDPYNVFDIRVFPGPDALAGLEVDADGAIERFTSFGNEGDVGRWDNNAMNLNKADYQFRLDEVSNSGPPPMGDSINIWLPASSGLNAWWVEEDFGIHSFTGTLRVRLAISPFTEYDSATMSLYAEKTP